METIFWISLVILIYVYFGYPICVAIISYIYPKQVRKESIEPTVTVIITAYNEELHLEKKILNTLALDYPKEKMKIIVASDESTDATDSIARSFEKEGVILMRQEPRRGKTAAQNKAVRMAKGEIIVFSDATTHYDKNVLRKIVENFADPEVGCVGGLLNYVRRGSDFLSGGGLYWNYETWVKKRESLLGTLIGVSGCLYAVRREIYNPLPEDLISDFLIAIEINRIGYRTVLEPEAISKEFIEDRTGSEFQMRVRVALRSLRALLRSAWALNIFRHTKLAWQLWSHKILRYSVPIFLILLFIASALIRGMLYKAFFSAQMLFYGIAAVGFILQYENRKGVYLTIPYYFCLVNAASLMAFVKLIMGEKYITWETTRK